MARTFCLLICLSEALFCSDVFWFSYKIVTVNSAVIYEEKNITPLSVPYEGKNQFLCNIDFVNDKNISKHQFLKTHFDTLLPCFYQQQSHLISWNENRQKQSTDRVELIIEPIRFTVDFKDEFATISTIR